MGRRRRFWGRRWNATTKLLAPGPASEDYEAMRKLLLASVLSLAASNAFAVSRFEITNVTCETVQALIQTEGAVILSLSVGRHSRAADLRSLCEEPGFCLSGEVMRGAGVPTADKKYCPVRKCVESEIFRAR